VRAFLPHLIIVILCTIMACSIALVPVLAFRLGAMYGSKRTVEHVKTWWRERGRNTHNPHYYVTEPP